MLLGQTLIAGSMHTGNAHVAGFPTSSSSSTERGLFHPDRSLDFGLVLFRVVAFAVLVCCAFHLVLSHTTQPTRTAYCAADVVKGRPFQKKNYFVICSAGAGIGVVMMVLFDWRW